MTFSVLIWFTAFVGYTTTTGIEDVNSYHVETEFLLLDSTIHTEHKLCNATYSEQNVTRQLATKPNITEPFTILCNISNDNRKINGTSIQACVNIFTDIEIIFSCYSGNDHNVETLNLTSSFPYDNVKLAVNNCSQPEINDLKLLYESNDDYNRSTCKANLKIAMINCSVGCTRNICSVNTRCVREINPTCLIPTYMYMYIRTIYECVHSSKQKEDMKTYANYNISYNCSKSAARKVTDCKAVNETTNIKCEDNGVSIQDQSISISLYPSSVADCLKINNISLEFPSGFCKGQNKNPCEINLINILGITLPHVCMMVQTRHIDIEYSCIAGTTKPMHGPSSTEMVISRIPDFTTTIVLSDSSTISKEEKPKADPASKGPIIGGIIGSIAFVAIFVVLAVYLRRVVHIMKNKNNGQSKDIVGSLIRQNSLRDYTGIQMVAYPGEGNKHLTNEMYRDIADDFQNKYGSDQRENFKGTERTNDSGKCASKYTLAKPIPNKLQLSNIQLQMTQSDCVYSMAKRISKEDKDGGIYTQSMSDLVASNEYQDLSEGVYDQAKRKRNKNDNHVYDRNTDDTYDTANNCAKRRTDDDDIAYDHFTGPKTNDNYDLVMRHNKVVSDDTYDVN